MSRKKNLKALAGLIFTIVVVVGVLVLPEPEEARANITYRVYVWWDNPVDDPDLGPLPVVHEDLILARFDWTDDGDYDDPEEEFQAPHAQGNGYYEWSFTQVPYRNWEAYLDDDELELIEPLDNPHASPITVGEFDWEVGF